MDGFKFLLIFLPGLGRPVNPRVTCPDDSHGVWLHLNLTTTLGSDNKITIRIIMTPHGILYVAGTVVSLYYFICVFITTLYSRYYLDPHYTEEETEVQRNQVAFQQGSLTGNK